MRERSQHFDPRQNMTVQTFEIFHYKEPKAVGVEVHHHDFYEVYHLLAGRVDYWVEGKIFSMEPGDLLLINPMELHRPVISGEDYERIVLWIDKTYLQNISQQLCSCFTAEGRAHLIRPTAAQRSSVTARLGELVRESYSNDPCAEFAARGIFLQFMAQLNRLCANSGKEQGRSLSDPVQKALQYISENISEELSLEKIANACFVSKYHLAHAFTGEVGVSVYRYILLRRLVLARGMLSAGESAGAVCRGCGFSDYSAFYRAFRSEYGISPGKVRAD